MATQRALIINTGVITQQANTDTLIVGDGIDVATGTLTIGATTATTINIGPTATTTAVNIGAVGTLTTVKGNLQVDGTETVTGTSTMNGNINLGDDTADLVTYTARIATDLPFLKEVNHTIAVDTSTTTDAVGGNLTINPGGGNGTGDGGNLVITGGAGNTGGGDGGDVLINGGTTVSGAEGDITVGGTASGTMTWGRAATYTTNIFNTPVDGGVNVSLSSVTSTPGASTIGVYGTPFTSISTSINDVQEALVALDAALTAGASPSLQTVYNNDADGSDAIITLTSTDGSILFRDNATPLGTTLFAVQDNAGTTDYLNVAASAVVVNAGSGNITFGGQGNAAAITLNQSGSVVLDTEYTATSIVGALNEVKFADGVLADNISGSTYRTVQDMQNIFHSAGWSSGGAITGGTDPETQIDVAAGTGFIRTTNSRTGDLLFFDWPSSDDITLPAEVSYIGVEYNAGSPQVITKTSNVWDYNTEFPLGTVVKVSGENANILQNEQAVGDHAGFMIRRAYETMPFTRDNRSGGLILGETGTRNVTVSAGALWDRLNRFSISAIDTSVSGTFRTYYTADSGSTWTTADVTQWPNTQYNDIATGLVAMTAGFYSNLWFYLDPDGDLYMHYGQAEYPSAAAAEAADAPATIATHQTILTKLIGRIIFQNGASTATQVQSVFTDVFTAASASVHGNLSGLGNDDHTQYMLLAGNSARNAVTGSIYMQSAQGTGSTDLFKVTGVSGAPTSTPSGEGHLVYDETGNSIYLYTGAGWDQTLTQNLTSFTTDGAFALDATGASALSIGGTSSGTLTFGRAAAIAIDVYQQGIVTGSPTGTAVKLSDNSTSNATVGADAIGVDTSALNNISLTDRSVQEALEQLDAAISGGNFTLQDAYTNGPDTGNTAGVHFELNATDGAIVVQDNATPVGDLFRIEKDDGTDILNVTPTEFQLLADQVFAKELAHRIDVADSTTADTAGGALTVAAGGGVGTGAGGALILTGGAATTGTGDGGNVSIQAGTTVGGTVGDINIGTVTSDVITLTSGGLMDVNAGANLDVDVTGTFDMLSSSSMSLDSTGASNVSVTSGNLSLETLTSGDVDINSAGNVLIDGGSISIDGTGASNLSVNGATLTVETITSGDLDFNSAEDVIVDAAGDITLQTSSTDRVVVTNSIPLHVKNGPAQTDGNLRVKGRRTTGNLAGFSLGDGLVFDQAINYNYHKFSDDVSSTEGGYFGPVVGHTSGAYAGQQFGVRAESLVSASNTQAWTGAVGIRGVQSSGGAESGSTGAITGSADFYAANFVNSGSVTLTNQYGFYVGDLTAATNNYGIYVNTPTGTIADAIHVVGGRTYLGGTLELPNTGTPGAGKVLTSDATGVATWENAGFEVTFSTVAGETMVAGALVAMDNDGGSPKAFLADPDEGGEREQPVGVAKAAYSASDPAIIVVSGEVSLDVSLFDSAPTAADVGKRVYVSNTTNGEYTFTPPVASGVRVTRVGILTDGSASPKMLIQIGEGVELA